MIEVKLTTEDGSAIDEDALAAVVLTEDAHRLRSAAAEHVHAESASAHPLPLAAQHGGRVTANPHSKSERLLTEGAALTDWVHMHAVDACANRQR